MSVPGRPTRKRRPELSQHFLREAPAHRLVQATSITKSDLVIEIGPGRGALTKPLGKRARRAIGVELDAYLAKKLRPHVARNVSIVAADFLTFDLPAEPYSVIGNIPFAKSTEIIERLAEATNPPTDAWLVVQRELAYRMCGLPFHNETLWSLRLKPFWHLEIVDRLKRTEFDPPPSVDSVFLRMSHRGRALIAEQEAGRYLNLVQTAFRGRSGTISQALRPKLSKAQVRRLADELRFRIDDTPADLMFEQWLGIFRCVERLGSRKK